MPISSRLVVRSTVGFLTIGLLALVAIVAATIWLSERAQFYFADSTLARETRVAAVEMRDALRTAESSQRGYLLTGNEIYLAPYDAAKSSAQRQLEGVNQRLAADARFSPMLRRLRDVVGEKLAEMDQTIAFKSNRQDADALSLFRSNRGKTLMDEANVFLFAIILASDEKLAAAVSEQRTNAAWLRGVSIAGGAVIILMVGALMLLLTRYTRELLQARQEVEALNAGLEEKVRRRTEDFSHARDRAEVLLAECNHRVANSLALVASLARLESNAVRDENVKGALARIQARIFAISSVHKRLYTSSDVRVVALKEYLDGLLENLETSMRSDGHAATLRAEIAPLTLPTNIAINLGVIVTEWVTNAFKYAYSDLGGEVRVRLAATGDALAELVVEDDGIGMRAEAPAKGTGVGGRIVKAMAAAMGARTEYEARNPGTTARLIFPIAGG